MTAIIEAPGHVETQKTERRDLFIREQIMTAFQESGYHRLCRVNCDVDDGFVDLGGIVSTFHLKQVAQSLVMRISQVRGIRNAIHVA